MSVKYLTNADEYTTPKYSIGPFTVYQSDIDITSQQWLRMNLANTYKNTLSVKQGCLGYTLGQVQNLTGYEQSKSDMLRQLKEKASKVTNKVTVATPNGKYAEFRGSGILVSKPTRESIAIFKAEDWGDGIYVYKDAFIAHETSLEASDSVELEKYVNLTGKGYCAVGRHSQCL